MNLTHIWLLCLTIFVAVQQVGDLGRWSKVGAELRALSEAAKAGAAANTAVVEYNRLNTELVTRLVKAQYPDLPIPETQK